MSFQQLVFFQVFGKNRFHQPWIFWFRFPFFGCCFVCLFSAFAIFLCVDGRDMHSLNFSHGCFFWCGMRWSSKLHLRVLYLVSWLFSWLSVVFFMIEWVRCSVSFFSVIFQCRFVDVRAVCAHCYFWDCFDFAWICWIRLFICES